MPTKTIREQADSAVSANILRVRRHRQRRRQRVSLFTVEVPKVLLKPPSGGACSSPEAAPNPGCYSGLLRPCSQTRR